MTNSHELQSSRGGHAVRRGAALLVCKRAEATCGTCPTATLSCLRGQMWQDLGPTSALLLSFSATRMCRARARFRLGYQRRTSSIWGSERLRRPKIKCPTTSSSAPHIEIKSSDIAPPHKTVMCPPRAALHCTRACLSFYRGTSIRRMASTSSA